MCWGGQLDYTDSNYNPYIPTGLNYNSISISDISLGGNGGQYCILDNGDVLCWGHLQQYGTTYLSSATQVTFVNNKIPISISSGGKHPDLMNFAIMSDNTMQCWGDFPSGYNIGNDCEVNNSPEYWETNLVDSKVMVFIIHLPQFYNINLAIKQK